MDSSNEHIEALARSVEEYERKTRRRIWISSLIPLVIGLLFLGYTVWQIRVYGEKLASVQIELTKQTDQLNSAVGTLQAVNGNLDQKNKDLNQLQVTSTAAATSLESKQQELTNLGNQLTQTTQNLQNTTDYLYNANSFIEFRMEIDPLAIKELYSNPDLNQQADMLNYLLALQQKYIPYAPSGFSEQEGFNSPNFTVYSMEQCGLISPNYGADAGPQSMLRVASDGPINGDIVVDGLGSGYSMFYFEVEGEKFLIGMTTQGILTLKPEFIKQPKYYHVPYDAPFSEFHCPERIY